MIQRQHRPLATWNGTRWVASGIIVGNDRDWGGGPVGSLKKSTITGHRLTDSEGVGAHADLDLSQNPRLAK